jgi:hypothetical protein
MPHNISKQVFWFTVFQEKWNFQCAFGDNLSVTHVFIEQIFWALEQAPPPPQGSVQGFGYGFEALKP